MENIRLKAGDCVLMKGLTNDEPMTLYYVTDVKGDKMYALRIYVHDSMVQGLEYVGEYDNKISDKAIFLSNGTYGRVKESMRLFLEETRNYLRTHCNRNNFKVMVGGNYWYRGIETIKEIDGNKTKYDLFRFEMENISPCWSGEGFVDDIESQGAEVTDEVFEEVKRRYRQYVSNLRESLVKSAI
ncbi:MAG: hypothetical protein IKR18_00380 [Bacteroidaceae bacterium]|nr:hypothetical protein [Bacteroidaceae bacterium]